MIKKFEEKGLESKLKISRAFDRTLALFQRKDATYPVVCFPKSWSSSSNTEKDTLVVTVQNIPASIHDFTFA